MFSKASIAVLSVALAALVAGCERSSNPAKEADHHEAEHHMDMASMKVDSPVHSIVMPHDEPEFPPGAGRDDLVTACVVCHSPRYITMQPVFARDIWLEEVNKMKNTYGAHISDEQALKITDYLVAVHGKPDAPGAPKNLTNYGE